MVLFRPLHPGSVPRQPVQKSSSCDSPCLSYLQLSAWEPPVTKSWTSLNKWQVWKCSSREHNCALPHLAFITWSMVSFICHNLQNLLSIWDHWQCREFLWSNSYLHLVIRQFGGLDIPSTIPQMDYEGFGSVRFKPTHLGHPLHRWQRTGTICSGPLHSPRAAVWGVCGAPIRPCWLLDPLHCARGAGKSFPVPPACRRALVTPWQGPEEGVAWRQPRFFSPSPVTGTGAKGPGSSARQTLCPQSVGWHQSRCSSLSTFGITVPFPCLNYIFCCNSLWIFMPLALGTYFTWLI